MIAIRRPSAAQFREAARKGVIGRSRGPVPPVVIEQSPGGWQIACNFGKVALAMILAFPTLHAVKLAASR